MLITITLEDLDDGGVEFSIIRECDEDDVAESDTSANAIAGALERRAEEIFEKAREMSAERRSREAATRAQLH